MVASTHFPRPSAPTEKTKLWDPSKTLGIINTDPGYHGITCVGHAPTKGRRCRNRISGYNRDFITNTLDEIACLPPHSPAVLSRLREIAAAGLCVRFHQEQAGEVVAQWRRKMQHLDVEVEVEVSSKPGKTLRGSKKQEFAPEYEHDVDDLKQQLRELRELLAQFQEERTGQGQSAKSNEQAEKKKREEERVREEREERERRAKRQEEERLENERIENERKEKEEAKKREQEEYNERIRQRAQKRREEEKRAKRQAEEKAKEEERARRQAEEKAGEEWALAWTEYQERWAQFRNSTKREGSVRDAVPWPVKSGLYSDVRASSVEEFLKRAVQRDANPSRMLRKECHKWHPDMMDRLLKGAVLTEVEGMAIGMICRVVTGLIDDSAARRSELFD